MGDQRLPSPFYHLKYAAKEHLQGRDHSQKKMNQSRAADMTVTVDMTRASQRLRRSGLIPSAFSMESIRATYDELHSDVCKNFKTNQKLLKHLLLSKNTVIKPYVNLVVRIWLLSPPESVVESMASAVKEVFGVHRNLTHANAAMECVIRWNGPELCAADQLIDAVVANVQQRSHASRGAAPGILTGMVLRRYLGNVCARSKAFFSGVSQKDAQCVRKRL